MQGGRQPLAAWAANAASGNRAVDPPFAARTACSPQDPGSVEDLTGALSLQRAPSTATRLAETNGTAVHIREALSRSARRGSGRSCRSGSGDFAVIRPAIGRCRGTSRCVRLAGSLCPTLRQV